MVRLVVGGVVAGVVVFMWGYVGHDVLPIGEMGILGIPNEDAALDAMRNSIQKPGFYYFPYHDPKETSQGAQQAWMEKLKKGPSGVLVIHPEGSEMITPRQLGTEVATNVVCALLAALLLAQTRPGLGYPGRVAFVTMLGVFGFAIVHIPFWNWYGFPLDFTTGQAIGHVVGWFLAGLVLAAIVRPRSEKVQDKVST